VEGKMKERKRIIAILSVLLITLLFMKPCFASEKAAVEKPGLKVEELFSSGSEGGNEKNKGDAEISDLINGLIDKLNPIWGSLFFLLPLLLVVESERAIRNRIEMIRNEHDESILKREIKAIGDIKEIFQKAELEYATAGDYVIPPYVYKNLEMLVLLDLEAFKILKELGNYVGGRQWVGLNP
jgi:hypothetical protein